MINNNDDCISFGSIKRPVDCDILQALKLFVDSISPVCKSFLLLVLYGLDLELLYIEFALVVSWVQR